MLSASYLSLNPAQWEESCRRLRSLLSPCRLCPRRCGVDRARGERGFCGIGARATVASFGPHFGEEPELVGRGGSGAIFFSGCNLGCLFCQNYDISLERAGEEATGEDLAKMMLALQSRGCHNINLVTPTHVVPQIVEALENAAQGGLRLPVVYNCGGYEEVETLRALAGAVDIYMPDFKFGGEAEAEKYCRAPRYPAVARSAIAEMHRQVGDLLLDPEGIAARGLLVRHLLLPGGLARSEEVFDFLSREISPDTYLNLMDQYRPVPVAAGFPELNRRITEEEYARRRAEILRSI